MREVIFIDFEASSLSDDSWPIEIGYAWLNEKGKLRSCSKLIKPHPTWPTSAWSEASEKIHGIPRSELNAAEEARNVARCVGREMGRALILSDAPAFDGKWMDRLMKTTEQDHAFSVSCIQQEARLRFEGTALRMFFRAFAGGQY